MPPRMGLWTALLLTSATSAMPWPDSGERPFSQFRLQHWDREAGLPGDETQALAIDSAGFLWIGTTEGLARFDGRRFRNFDSRSDPAFASNEVRSLAADEAGKVYVMLASGPLLHGDARGFVQLANLPDVPGTQMLPAPDGGLFICRPGGVWRYAPAAGLVQVAASDGYVNCARDPSGGVYAAADGAWLTLAAHDGAQTRRTGLPPRPHPLGNGIHVDPHSVWIWDYSTLIEFAHDGSEKRRLATPEALRACTQVHADAEGTLWCSTNSAQGLARAAGGLPRMAFTDGPVGKSMALAADASGGLWVASWGQGIFRVSAPAMLTYGSPEGVRDPRIAFLHQRDKRTLLLGSREQLYLLQDGRAQPLVVPTRDLDRLLDVLTLDNGDLLLARVLSVDRSPWPPTADSWSSVLGGVRPEGHYVLERRVDGDIWIGTRGLLALRADGRLQSIDPGLTTAYAFVDDAAGVAHAATKAGVWKQQRDGRFERIDTPGPAGRFILMSALRDSRGQLWFGGYELGLIHHDGRAWVRLTNADGLPSETGYGMVEDSRGRLWISHGRGLYTLELDSVASYLADRKQPLRIREYSVADGLRSETFNGGSGRPALKGGDGTLWFASDAGAVRVDPTRLPAAITAPRVRIDAIDVDGQKASAAGGVIELAAGAQSTRLQLVVPAPGVADRVDARWRLATEAAWRPLPADGEIELQRLPAGVHRLLVEVGVDGAFQPGLALELGQLPLWYRRSDSWWLLGTATLALAGLLARWRLRALRLRNQRLQALVDERGAALVDEQRQRLEEQAARQEAERALRFRRLAAAQAHWARLDALARIVLHPLAAAAPAPLTVADLAAALRGVQSTTGVLSAASLLAALRRLQTQGVAAAEGEGWRLLDLDLPLLADLALPLEQLALRNAPRVGAFRLLELIGSGGHGEVYRAVNIDDGSPAALKLLRADPELRRDAARRLDREGAIVSRLHHPNIVRMLERGEHDGRLYLAMELVGGETLSKRIERVGALAAGVALAIARQLADALTTLHAAGVVHRDLNPNNIMVEDDGRVVLLDFGLARGHRHSTLTRPQTLLGTLPYIAPEQLHGAEAGPPADLWAFGVVCAELLGGRLPWRGETSVEMAVEVGRFRSWSDYPRLADPRWDALVESMLRLDPAARADAAGIAETLRRWR